MASVEDIERTVDEFADELISRLEFEAERLGLSPGELVGRITNELEARLGEDW